MYGYTFCLSLLIICLINGISAAAVQKDLLRKIYGGQESSVDKLPYMASLQVIIDGQNFSHVCGSSIIDEYHLLTAAHCFGNREPNPDSYRVVVGQTDLCAQNKYVDVDFIKLHPSFTTPILQNDIAVVKVKKPLPIGTSVKPIPLSTKEPVVGEMCTASGWGLTLASPSIKGTTIDGITSPCILRKVQLPIISLNNNYCPASNKLTQVCAGYYRDSGALKLEGVWKGDSGGPLVCDGEVKGVASGSRAKPNENLENEPALFTNVKAFTPWLQEVISSKA